MRETTISKRGKRGFQRQGQEKKSETPSISLQKDMGFSNVRKAKDVLTVIYAFLLSEKERERERRYSVPLKGTVDER